MNGKIVTLNEYQIAAARTDSPNRNQREAILNAALGMVGEAAETSEHVKKVMFQGHEFSYEKLIEEAGDCLWYVAKMARACNVTLEELANKNIEKLRKRYPGVGFEVEKSIERVI